MQALFAPIRTVCIWIIAQLSSLIRWYRKSHWLVKVLIGAGLVFIAVSLLSSPDDSAGDPEGKTGRFVTLATVAELSGSEESTSFVGTVRSTSEADILARTGGTVTSVNTQLSATIPAGFVIATLENASERAAVLQAEGAYEGALAARSTYSLEDTEQTARDAYQSAYTILDTTLEKEIGSFFGETTVVGPRFLVSSASMDERARLSRERREISKSVDDFQANALNTSGRDITALLDEAESLVRWVQTFLTQIAEVVNQSDSSATATQIDNLATARTAINDLLVQITSARSGLRTEVIGATASADAAVKQALGVLRAAEANLEQTIIRAPIGGQIEFLPIRVGDYVTALEHVATVAQRGALEIIAYVGEEKANSLAIGEEVLVQDEFKGIVTALAPALDPVRKQIEVRIALATETPLVGGESVRIRQPLLENQVIDNADMPVLLPLSSVKLRSGDRIVFSVGEHGELVAHPVDVGDVRGDRIEITSELPKDLSIVVDARGFAEGETVRITDTAH